MLLIKFKQQVHLCDISRKNGKIYSRGIHEVPAMHYESAFFQKLAKAGLVEEVDAPKKAPKEKPMSEKQMALLNKIAPKLEVPAEPKKPEKQDDVPAVEEPKEDVKNEEVKEEETSQEKPKKKGK